MQKKIKKLGVLIFLLGTVIIINSSLFNLTGNIIGNANNFFDSILGLILIIGGLALFLSQKSGNGLEVKVYDTSKGKRKEERFYEMTDPNLYFSNVGKVNLSEFKKGINEIKDDAELIQLVREEYGKQLLTMQKEGRGSEKNLSRKFIDILYGKRYLGNIGKKDFKKEKEKIRRAFDPGWVGKLNNAQSKILKEFNFAYKPGRKHGRIYSISNPKNYITVSSTPSDVNTGKNIAKDLLNLIKK